MLCTDFNEVEPIREASSFWRVLCTDFNGFGPIREVSSFQGVLIGEVPPCIRSLKTCDEVACISVNIP